MRTSSFMFRDFLRIILLELVVCAEESVNKIKPKTADIVRVMKGMESLLVIMPGDMLQNE